MKYPSLLLLPVPLKLLVIRSAILISAILDIKMTDILKLTIITACIALILIWLDRDLSLCDLTSKFFYILSRQFHDRPDLVCRYHILTFLDVTIFIKFYRK